MENATKALLIAAAVLIAILIISLGLVVYNRAAETVNNGMDLSEYEVQKFNEKFRKYEGTNVTGSDVNAMANTVFNHNMAQEDPEATGVAITDDLVLEVTATQSPAKVPTGSRYTVVCVYNETTGLVNSITVTENT